MSSLEYHIFEQVPKPLPRCQVFMPSFLLVQSLFFVVTFNVVFEAPLWLT
jgi:hypothetical protein